MEFSRERKIFNKTCVVLEKKDDDNKIVLWPDLPYWIYTSEICASLISLINGYSFDEIPELIKTKFQVDPDENELLDLINSLFEASAFYHESDKNDYFEETNFTQPVIQYITFNITDVCNLYCTHCYIDASNKGRTNMSFEDAKLIIDKIYPFMIKSCNVNVSGGEALLNKDSYRILKYFNERGKGNLTLVTNATLITNQLAQQLKDIDNLRIQISLDGASKSVHENIRGENTYNKTLEDIQILIKHGHRVYLSPIVTYDFFNEIEDYFLLAKELGVKAIFLQPIICVGRAKNNNLKRVNDALVFKKVVAIYENDPQLIEYIPGTLEAIYVANIKLLERCKYCGTGTATITIQPNGDCYPCPNTMLPAMKCGNVLTDNFNDIWSNSPVLSQLRKISVNRNLSEKCTKCEVKYFCGGGCRGQALQNTGDLYGISPTCEYEKEQRIEMLWTIAQKPQLFENEVIRQLKIKEERSIETQNTINLLKESFN